MNRVGKVKTLIHNSSRFSLRTLFAMVAVAAVLLFFTAVPVARYRLNHDEKVILRAMSSKPVKVERTAAGPRSVAFNWWNQKVSSLTFSGGSDGLLEFEDGDMQLISRLPRLDSVVFKRCDFSAAVLDLGLRLPPTVVFENCRIPFALLDEALADGSVKYLYLRDTYVSGDRFILDRQSSLITLSVSGEEVDDDLLLALTARQRTLERLSLFKLGKVTPQGIVAAIQSDSLEEVRLGWGVPVTVEFFACLLRRPKIRIFDSDEARYREMLDTARKMVTSSRQ